MNIHLVTNLITRLVFNIINVFKIINNDNSELPKQFTIGYKRSLESAYA